MVPTAGVAADHKPPAGEQASPLVVPAQTRVLPIMAVGDALTVIVANAKSIPSVYVITVVPADTPFTIPVVDPIVAIAGLPLVHVPPVTGLESDAAEPAHSVVGPNIGGNAARLTNDKTKQKTIRLRCLICIHFMKSKLIYRLTNLYPI
jgi:hypothetical protein